jgi:hypothetical protein
MRLLGTKETSAGLKRCVFSVHMQEFPTLWVKVGRSGRTRPWPFLESTSTPWTRKGG